nr:polysaccharide pyruvyl transferase family protein [Methanocella arvoryzae]
MSVNPGFANKGDAALLEGAFKYMRTFEDARICLLSKNPDFDRKRCDVPVVGLDQTKAGKLDRTLFKLRYLQYFPLALVYHLTGKYLVDDRLVVANYLWKEYCFCDVMVTGLDDGMNTLYGSVSFNLIFLDTLLARLLNKKVVLFGGSIGPFRNKRFERLGKYILQKPDLITLREEISYETFA